MGQICGEAQETRNSCRILAGYHMGDVHMENREGPSILGKRVSMNENRESSQLAIFVISDDESFCFVARIFLWIVGPEMPTTNTNSVKFNFPESISLLYMFIWLTYFHFSLVRFFSIITLLTFLIFPIIHLMLLRTTTQPTWWKNFISCQVFRYMFSAFLLHYFSYIHFSTSFNLVLCYARIDILVCDSGNGDMSIQFYEIELR